MVLDALVLHMRTCEGVLRNVTFVICRFSYMEPCGKMNFSNKTEITCFKQCYIRRRLCLTLPCRAGRDQNCGMVVKPIIHSDFTLTIQSTTVSSTRPTDRRQVRVLISKVVTNKVLVYVLVVGR
jgi:hypothetical protein